MISEKLDSQIIDVVTQTRGHRSQFDVPPVQFLWFTIRKGYTQQVFIPCEHGKTLLEEVADSVFLSPPLYAQLRDKEKSNG